MRPVLAGLVLVSTALGVSRWRRHVVAEVERDEAQAVPQQART
ncbi:MULTISPECIES: hypothetical protein [Streptomycetaceae]|nr:MULTISPECIES: hypothetical protein [Streptomycetaceae]